MAVILAFLLDLPRQPGPQDTTAVWVVAWDHRQPRGLRAGRRGHPHLGLRHLSSVPRPLRAERQGRPESLWDRVRLSC